MDYLNYALAGYDERKSEEPAYVSSPFGMAYQCGVWCKKNNILPQEIKPSRGYTWIVNRSYKLNFKDDSYNPTVTRI